MYCTNCGAKVGDVKFCQRCGTEVRREDYGEDQFQRGGRQGRASRSNAWNDARRKAEEYVRDPKRTQELLTTALNKASARRTGEGPLDEIWEYLQLAVRLVQASLSREYTGLSGKSLTLIVGAILYYVSPIDIIPDFLPIAGLLDDVSILAFALRSIKTELDAFRKWEAEQGRGPRM